MLGQNTGETVNQYFFDFFGRHFETSRDTERKNKNDFLVIAGDLNARIGNVPIPGVSGNNGNKSWITVEMSYLILQALIMSGSPRHFLDTRKYITTAGLKEVPVP